MKEDSAPVVSRQTQPHPRLAETVIKHSGSQWRKPVAEHSRRAFAMLASDVRERSDSLILDTGCGTGMSTNQLARQYPDSLVLGVDKSLARLNRAGPLPSNARLVRMDLEDFWLLAAEAGWRFERQYFLYPNPWPKPEQRLRRWPFHPVLPVALSCGGIWELRTNWKVYAQEFAQAFGILTGVVSDVEVWRPSEVLTLFEKKYLASGHDLWRWVGSVREKDRQSADQNKVQDEEKKPKPEKQAEL